MEEMQRLVALLNEATDAYENGRPTISDEEWDRYYFQLVKLERELDTVLPNSPSQAIRYRTVNSLQKVEHNHPMLSLDKTKNLVDLRAFIGDKEPVIAMCKMDGLTCSLTYEEGILVRAETRGNGEVGEDITHNAYVVPSIPKTINHNSSITIDGEIICPENIFYEKFSSQYSNARNFAAGSIRLLEAKECAERSLVFVAWDIPVGAQRFETLSAKLELLATLGFITAPYCAAGRSGEAIQQAIERLQTSAAASSYPIDGIVFKYDSCSYYNSLGYTGHHFRGGLAFKFYDETYPTHLLNIEWTMGRTGQLTPVAILEPVEIDGAVIERANLHNINIMTELIGNNPYIGQPVRVYRANMIIPQIYDSDKEAPSEDVQHLIIPSVCPVCGGATKVEYSNDTINLVCTNPDCEGKLVNKLDYFASKKGLDIKGLSKNTLSKLIDWGWVSSIKDLFTLSKHEQEWSAKEGFGKKSVQNILSAIESARHTTFSKFLSALAIPLIGNTYSKKLAEETLTYETFREMVNDDVSFTFIDGIGPQMDIAIRTYDYHIADELIKNQIIVLESAAAATEQANTLQNVTFCVTGKLKQFKNRDEIIALIESKGGKVSGSVSSKTTYLINNDFNSTSSKNETAKKLGIPIITEEQFLQLI